MSKQTIVPYLCIKGADEAIVFYKNVFEAKELDRYQDPGEPVGHCTLEIYGNHLFVSDEFPEINVVSPATLHGSPVAIHLLVPDVDGTVSRAKELGANVEREPADQPYGERNAKFVDPFGHRWMVATPLAN